MAIGRWLIIGVGFSMILFLVTANTLLQTSTPDHLRGRVMGVHSWLMIGLTPAGSIIASSIAASTNVVRALTIGGTITMLIVAVIAIKAPALRRANRTLPKCPVRFRSIRERIIVPDA
jgi:MFS family permease